MKELYEPKCRSSCYNLQKICNFWEIDTLA